jgi:hypothetical protein
MDQRMNEKKNLNEIIALAFKAIALAMAAAAIALIALNVVPTETIIVLLSIGLFSQAVSSF